MKPMTFATTANEKQFRGQLTKIVAAGIAVHQNIQDAIEFALSKYLAAGVLADCNTGYLTDIVNAVEPLGHKTKAAIVEYIRHRANVTWNVPKEEGKYPHFKKAGKYPEVKDSEAKWFDYAKAKAEKSAPKPAIERVERFVKTLSKDDDVVAAALGGYIHSKEFQIAVARIQAAKEERLAREGEAK